MRFASIIVSGFFAAVAVAQGTETASTPATSVSLTPAEQSQADCLKACPVGNVNCQSHCITVPSPNEDQVNATTACVAACPKGNGTPEDTQKYTVCMNNCISSNYYSSSVGTPEATGAPGNNGGSNGGSSGKGGNSGSGASPTGSGSGGSGSGGSKTTGSGSKTSASATTTATHNAAPVYAGSALLGLLGAVVAL